VVALFAPLLVYIWPPQGQAKPVDLKVNLPTPLDQIPEGDGVKIEAPKAAAFTMVDGGGDNAPGDYAFGGFVVKDAGKVNVFAINCSHLGCSIALNAGAKRFECPCHGSMFALSGNVIHGPAVAPLSHLAWKQGDAPDIITVKGVSLPGYG
jgi:Rieske Fe-S protein